MKAVIIKYIEKGIEKHKDVYIKYSIKNIIIDFEGNKYETNYTNKEIEELFYRCYSNNLNK